MSSTPTPEQQAALIAAGISPALVEFVEFVEEDGTPIEWCDAECGWSTIDADDGMWLLPNRETGDNFFWTGDNPCHCPRCGAVLGVTDSYHKPYRVRFSRVVEALAHRDRALEWACDRLGEEALTCPDAPFDGCHAPDDYDCAGHWREAALAATEEGGNDA